ncbi:MAG: hypothetical protein AAGA56_27210 [Myxococcota bacterium]
MIEAADEFADRCGSCAAYVRQSLDAQGRRIGECALEIFPPPLRATATCTRYRPKGASGAAPRPRAAGEPRRRYPQASPRPAHASGRREFAPVVVRQPLPQEIDIDMDIDEFRRVLREVIADELGVSSPELGQRWQGGELVLEPGNTDTQSKRVPIETFFHKLVMIRDKLRVLESKVNGHKGLSDEEKVQLQAYITGCYGSLTTFNVLFQQKEDGFSTKK